MQTDNTARIAIALDDLRNALRLFKAAKAPKAAAAVRRAISSAKGARRHAELAPYREARQKAKANV